MGTIYQRGVFNPAKAEASFGTLHKQGFFAGGHRVHLKDEAASINKAELDQKIELIHKKIDGDEVLKKLRTSASIWFGSLTLTPIVCEYLKQYPEVNIELSLTDRYVDIIEEGFDVAIRIGDLKDSSLVARKLGMFEVAICASPEYLTNAGTPNIPEDLARHQCLGFTNWQSQGGWRLMQKHAGIRISSTPRFESDNGQALLTAALKGIGIIMMPRELLKKDIESGKLVELLKAHVPPVRPIHAVYPGSRQSVPKLTSFIDYLMQTLRP